jgi:hypothetical protein
LLLVVGLAATGFGAYDYVQQSEAVESATEITETDVETDSRVAPVSISVTCPRPPNASRLPHLLPCRSSPEPVGNAPGVSTSTSVCR